MNIPSAASEVGRVKGHETQRQQYEARLEARLREAVQPLLRYGVPLEDAMCAAVVIHRISLLCGYDRALRMLKKGSVMTPELEQDSEARKPEPVNA